MLPMGKISSLRVQGGLDKRRKEARELFFEMEGLCRVQRCNIRKMWSPRSSVRISELVWVCKKKRQSLFTGPLNLSFNILEKRISENICA